MTPVTLPGIMYFQALPRKMKVQFRTLIATFLEDFQCKARQ